MLLCMSMLTERLQVLISPAQRERLEAEASRRGVSAAAIVRAGINRETIGSDQERRLAASEWFLAQRARAPIDPDALRQLIDERPDLDVLADGDTHPA